MYRRIMIGIFAGVLMLATALVGGCAKPPPTLQVVAEQVGKDLVVKVQTTNFKVGQSGHIHMKLNGGPEIMFIGNTYTLANAKPGPYSIFVELSDPNHQNLNVQQTIETEIK